MKSNLLLFLLADDEVSGIGPTLGLILFAAAMLAAAGVLMVAVQKRWWQITALVTFIWCVIGVLLQPWTLLPGHMTSQAPGSEYWLPMWRIASVFWGVILLLCLVCMVSVLAKRKSGSRRRRRRSHHRSSHQSTESE